MRKSMSLKGLLQINKKTPDYEIYTGVKVINISRLLHNLCGKWYGDEIDVYRLGRTISVKITLPYHGRVMYEDRGKLQIQKLGKSIYYFTLNNKPYEESLDKVIYENIGNRIEITIS